MHETTKRPGNQQETTNRETKGPRSRHKDKKPLGDQKKRNNQETKNQETTKKPRDHQETRKALRAREINDSLGNLIKLRKPSNKTVTYFLETHERSYRDEQRFLFRQVQSRSRSQRWNDVSHRHMIPRTLYTTKIIRNQRPTKTTINQGTTKKPRNH